MTIFAITNQLIIMKYLFFVLLLLLTISCSNNTSTEDYEDAYYKESEVLIEVTKDLQEPQDFVMLEEWRSCYPFSQRTLKHKVKGYTINVESKYRKNCIGYSLRCSKKTKVERDCNPSVYYKDLLQAFKGVQKALKAKEDIKIYNCIKGLG